MYLCICVYMCSHDMLRSSEDNSGQLILASHLGSRPFLLLLLLHCPLQLPAALTYAPVFTSCGAVGS